MKKCTRCKEAKDISEFHKNKRNKDGTMNQCKVCLNAANLKWYYSNLERARTTGNNWDKLNSAKRVIYKRKYRYGMTQENYNQMLESQKGKCAICPSAGKLVVDHCHKTGKIRGLLCNGCNVGLGSFRDNQDYIASAIAYLKRE